MPRHVLTLISHPSGESLRANTSVIPALRARLNPVRIVWLSDHACDLEFDAVPTRYLMEESQKIAHGARIDAVLQPMENREKQLLVSDMDSTMIAQECIDELADAVGLKAHVSAITERAMNGELDFPTALRARVALLKNLPVEALGKTYRERITLMSGARTLVQTMKARGAKTLLVSGGFTYFTSRVAAAIGFDVDEANELLFSSSLRGAEGDAAIHLAKKRKVDCRGLRPRNDERLFLTGTVREPILGKEAKRESLIRAATHYNIPLSRTMAVGDGANDLPMIQTAGLGIAYHAKPVVEKAAPASIRFNDLTALLYIQGIPKADWR